MGGIRIPQDYFKRRMIFWRVTSFIVLSLIFASWLAVAYLCMGVLKCLR